MKKIFLFILLTITSNILYASWQSIQEVDATLGIDREFFSAANVKVNTNGYTLLAYTLHSEEAPNYTNTLKVAISYDFGKTWDSIVTVDNSEPNLSDSIYNYNPKIAFYDDNTAFIAYNTYDDVNNIQKLKVAKFVNSSFVITEIDQISTSTSQNITRPEIAIKDNFIMIIYQLLTTGSADIKSATSNNSGSSWNLSVIDHGTIADTNIRPKVTMSSDNGTIKALAAWTLPDLGGVQRNKTATYTTSSGWENIQVIDSSDRFPLPDVYMTDDGHAILASLHHDITGYSIYKFLSSDYGVSWGAADTVFTFSTASQSTWISVAMNSLGNAAISWQPIEASNRVVKLALFDNFGSTIIETKTLTGTSIKEMIPEIDLDNFGNLFFTYTTSSGTLFNIYRGLYSFSEDLLTYDTITTNQINEWNYIPPRISVAKSTSKNYINAINTWTIADLTSPESMVFVKRYEIINISLSAMGSQEKISFFLQRKLKNTILTNAIDEEGTFYLYKDSNLTNLIDSVSAFNQAVKLDENNIKKETSNTYYVTWSDGTNTLGPVMVIING